MSYFAQRKVIEIDETGFPYMPQDESNPIEDFRECDAYVLLGPAGAGKTTVFRRESQETNRGLYVSARDFLSQEEWSKWEGKTLFIDGFDEVRCGSDDVRIPLDKLRRNLTKMGNPQFRLSCREADWFGINDSKHLRDSSPNGQVAILRLEPLSSIDIIEILRRNYTIEDPEYFVNRAETLGISDLLFNPQSLRMLVKVVNNGLAWPDSRRETFDMACNTLVGEHNEEHLIAKQHISTVKSINIAGRLCAILLLTGNSGFLRQPDSSQELIPIPQILGDGRLESYLQVLASKLFEKSEDESYVPVHRQVAEYLGSKYLTSKIRDGLPLGRILSLIEYDDGSIVSEMRGLGAWLATNCPPARAELISRDPIGTVLYGDVKGFSTMERCRLLTNIRPRLSKDPQILRTLVNDSRTGDLATEETAPLFQDALSTRSPSEHLQWYARSLVSALTHGTVHPELYSTLWSVVRNSRWRTVIRVATLDLLLSKGLSHQSMHLESEVLLQEIHAGTVEDEDDELRGSLLHHFYGKNRSLTGLLDCLEEPKIPNLFGKYQNFWLQFELEDISLDELMQSLDIIKAKLDAHRSRHAVAVSLLGKLFLRFLSYVVDHVSLEHIDKLIAWLDVARKVQVPGSQITERLKKSLGKRSDLMTAIISSHVERPLKSPDFADHVHHLEILLLNIDYQAVIGSEWFLNKALSTVDERAAHWYTRKLAGVMHSTGADRRHLFKIESHLQGASSLLDSFNARMQELQNIECQESSLANEYWERRKEGQDYWRKAIAAESFSDNNCSPGLLNQLAQAYFGEAIDVEGDSPKERLQDLFGEDTPGLLDTVLDGLRTVIHRDDLPDPNTILMMRSHGKVSALGLPILAGLQEETGANDSNELHLSESQRRSALAVYYSMRLPQSATRPPRWLIQLLESDPETCAEVLVQAVRVRLKAGDECREICYELAYSPKHSRVAALAVLPLLRTFPVRSANRLLIALTWLLRAASNHCASDAIRAIVEKRLAKSGMNMGQRIRWMGAQLLLDQDSFRESFQSYIESSDQRVSHLVQFLSEQVSSTKWIDTIDSSTATMLAGVIGRKYSPIYFDIHSDIYSSDSAQASKCISTLIDKLTFDPSEDAKQFLEELVDDQELSSWHSRLKHAAHTQKTVRQTSRFGHGEVRSVLGVLDDGEPVCVSDLKAVTLEALGQIRTSLRDGDTSWWRKFWNTGSHGRVIKPKVEDECRDILVDELRSILQRLNISVQHEALFADRKRCDITLGTSSFRLPMELKLSHSQDLFTAIDCQLVKKYARDNLCDGQGIYLVLWFGDSACSRRTSSPDGSGQPISPSYLEDVLRKSISSDLREKIAICVIDVSELQGS